MSRRRPYADFLLISLAAFALAAGPAVAAGLARLRDRGVWLLAGGALVALAAADLSGMSKGETERIWLHLVPWLLVATVALARLARLARRPGRAGARAAADGALAVVRRVDCAGLGALGST